MNEMHDFFLVILNVEELHPTIAHPNATGDPKGKAFVALDTILL